MFARPTVFHPGLINLAPLQSRLVELAPAYRADELFGFAPVRQRVLNNVPDAPPHLKLVPISYDPEEMDRVVEAAAELLGIEGVAGAS